MYQGKTYYDADRALPDTKSTHVLCQEGLLDCLKDEQAAEGMRQSDH
jgi:hypothetical protein